MSDIGKIFIILFYSFLEYFKIKVIIYFKNVRFWYYLRCMIIFLVIVRFGKMNIIKKEMKKLGILE